MINREQFAEMWDEEKPGLGGPNSPLWLSEESLGPVRCEWFVCVRPISAHSKELFWQWCNQNLQGQCRCFSSNPEMREEWWGFTDQNDAVIWLLKWHR